MKLKVLNSNSKGNCYILQNENEALVIECGVKFSEVKKALDFNVSKVVAALVSHEHGDHAKYVNDALNSGIEVFTSPGTISKLKLKSNKLPVAMQSKEIVQLGNFKVMAFDVKHDCAEPYGFLIEHPDTGVILFATDTYYLPYKFDNLSHILLECNYSMDILNANYNEGKVHRKVRDRVIESHMNVDTCCDTLRANNLTDVRNIILLHLSDSNSNEKLFLKQVKQATGKRVFVASRGFEIELNKNIF